MVEEPRRPADDVFASERQEHIARMVEEHGRVRVSDLSEWFGVSTVTIRKDLLALEGDGRLIRAHGGAIAREGRRPESSFDVRERLNRAAKDQIGRAAAEMVSDGESIAFDASTTALAVARHLKSRGGWINLTVITNGLRIAGELAGYPGITVVMPGGFVRWEALSVVGQIGNGLFEQVNVQKAFLGAAGFTLESGLSDATEEEAQIKRLMAGAATRGDRDRRQHEMGQGGVRDVLPHGRRDRGRGRLRPRPIAMTTALQERGVDLRLVPAEAGAIDAPTR